MLIIELDDKKENEMKDVFRKWFFKESNLKEFSEIIKEDINLRNIIFNEAILELKKKTIDYYCNIIEKINKDSFEIKDLLQKDEIEEYKNILEEFFFSKFYYESGEYTSKYVKKLSLSENTINYFHKKYKNFRDSQGSKIVEILDIGVCPYCNRNFIDVYSKNNNSYFKGEFDHYYPKSKYPHLALCLFNMIPVCKTCNHEKSNIDKQVLYPYRNKGEDYCKFELSCLTENDKYDITHEKKINNLEEKQYDFTYLMGISDNFKIELKSKETEHQEIVRNTEEVFNLNKKYNNSKLYVKNLLRKRYIFNESYLESISETFNEIFKSPKEAKQVLFSIDLENPNFNERPFSKLTYDILKELGYKNEED